MGENIEVKDVQKTEYLDKNGLDMLWAKVKENTRNQVEVESNRAVEQETRIIETKADKSEFSNYVPSATFTALEKKVSANTAAISNKQNAGNYLHYETLNNEGYYEIPSVCISGSDGSTKTDIDSQNISVNGNDGTTASIASDEIRVSNEALGYTIITCDKVRHYYDEGSLGFDLNSDGVKLQGGDDNHVLTSNGSTIDIRDYAKKTDIPEVDTSDFVSKTATDSQIINSFLEILGGGIQIVDYTADEDQVSLELASTGLEFNGSDRSTIELNASDVNSNKRSSRIIIEAFNENPEIMLQGTIGSDYAFQNNLTITNEGISSTDNSANHVYATDGSIADLTEYIKIASNITTKGFGSIKTVDAINNNIGVGDNTSSLAYIGNGELGAIKYNGDGYATESFRYTSSYGLETTNTLGYKNVKIPCDQNYVCVYKSNSNDYYTKYGYSGVQLGENNDDSNLLNTNGSYKTIGTDITPLENGKVPAEYLDLSQYAKKSEIADKVDTTALTALEEKVTANTTAIEGKQDAGNYIPYNMLAFKNKYVIEPSYSIEFRTDALNNKYGKAFIGPQIISITSASGQNTAVEPEEISIKQSGNASGRIHSTLNVDSFGVYNNSDDSVIFKLNQYGIKLEDGDDNHVLTSNASTIDIREYVLKSVYDKKIASLEARIAALEAKHAETA